MFRSINSIIGNLYNLNIIIWKGNLNGDIFLKSPKVNVAFYEVINTKHTRNKFPSANDTLVERLRKAITKRRQYLKYWEQHHEKLSVPRQKTFIADQPIDEDRLPPLIETNTTSLLLPELRLVNSRPRVAPAPHYPTVLVSLPLLPHLFL